MILSIDFTRLLVLVNRSFGDTTSVTSREKRTFLERYIFVKFLRHDSLASSNWIDSFGNCLRMSSDAAKMDSRYIHADCAWRMSSVAS